MPMFHGPDVKAFRKAHNLTQKEMKAFLTFSKKNGFIPMENGKPVLKKISNFDVKESVIIKIKNVMNAVDGTASEQAENSFPK